MARSVISALVCLPLRDTCSCWEMTTAETSTDKSNPVGFPNFIPKSPLPGQEKLHLPRFSCNVNKADRVILWARYFHREYCITCCER